MNKLLFHDTTLRDGEQGIGNVMSLAQKTAVLEQLDRLPLDFIEIGFPASSEDDFVWTQRVSSIPMRAKPIVFARPVPADLKKTIAATENFAAVQYQLLGTGSEIHQQLKRRLPLADLMNELEDAIGMLQRAGRDDITVILEDASRGSTVFLQKVASHLSSMGVRSITLADTVGYAVPAEIKELMSAVRDCVGSHTSLGIHCHNDLGLATANTLSAISSGASLIQGTMGGLGERAGNCALEEIITVLQYKEERWPANQTRFDLQVVHDVAHQIHRILGKSIPPTKPLLGEHVFSTAAGIHQNGILKSPEVYEYISPLDFGRERKFVFNRLSGRTLLKAALTDVDDANLNRFNDWLLELKEEVEAKNLPRYFEQFKKSECGQGEI